MASGKKQAQQFARQILELSLVNGAVSAERVAGVLAPLEPARPAHVPRVLPAPHRPDPAARPPRQSHCK